MTVEFLIVVGWIIGAVGGIWILVKAFQESIWWGLGSLFVPIVGLIFVLTHWQEAGKPFLIQLGGSALMVVGYLLSSPPA